MVDCSFLLKRALGGCCLALVAFCHAAQAPNVSWSLDHVTCHEVGALLHFEGDVSVPQSQRVLLEGLPEDVDVALAKVELPPGIALVSINRARTAPDVADDVAWLTKQVDARRLALDLELALLHSLDQERAYLEANRSIGSENEVLLVDDVEEMRHYLAQKHQELALRRVDIASNVRDLELQLQSAESDLAALKAEATREMHGLELVLAGEDRVPSKWKSPRNAPVGSAATTCHGTTKPASWMSVGMPEWCKRQAWIGTMWRWSCGQGNPLAQSPRGVQDQKSRCARVRQMEAIAPARNG